MKTGDLPHVLILASDTVSIYETTVPIETDVGVRGEKPVINVMVNGMVYQVDGYNSRSDGTDMQTLERVVLDWRT